MSATGGTGPSGNLASEEGTDLRVLGVTTGEFPTYSGAGQQALNLAERIEEYGVETELLAFAGRDGNAASTADRIRVVSSGSPPPFDKAGRYAGFLYHLLRNLRRYDIIHLHGLEGRHIRLAALSGRLLGTPVVGKITMSGADDPAALEHSGGTVSAKVLLDSLDVAVAISSEIRDTWLSRGYPESRIVSIPNGVDVRNFRPASLSERAEAKAALGYDPQEPLVLFVGLINERKGVDSLVEAWLRVRERAGLGAHPRLALVGPCGESGVPAVDSRFVERLRATIESSSHAGAARIPGLVDDVRPWYRAADLLVLPTHREGLPNVLLEAMAMGLPVIASDLQCIRDVITGEEHGLLVPTDAPGELADAMTALLDDPDRCSTMGEAARRRIEDAFSLDSVAARYSELYRDLAGA